MFIEEFINTDFLKNININIELNLDSINHIYKIFNNNILNIIQNLKFETSIQNLKNNNCNFQILAEYIIKNNKINHNISINNLTKQQFYNQFRNNQENFNIFSEIDLDKIFFENNIEDFPVQILNRFMDPDVFDETLQLKNKQIINCEYKKNKLNLTIFYNKINFFKIFIIIIKIFSILEYLSINNKNLSITLFFNKAEKKIPESNMFTPKEINSGVTIHYFNGIIKIYLYREEEIEKVTIHELIHGLDYDLAIRKNFESVENKIKCNFNVSKKNIINIFEAFTETTALIFNTILNSILFNKNLEDLFLNEIKFSLFQCLKILKFYNLNINNLFNKNSCFESNENWIEKTSVFSYFFLKTISLLNIDKFIKEFIFTKNNEIHYYYFLINNTEIFLKKINEIHDFFHLFNIKKIKNSMRMSLQEFEFNFI